MGIYCIKDGHVCFRWDCMNEGKGCQAMTNEVMTEPTEAQIEAALAAYWGGHQVANPRERMRAALTAAAAAHPQTGDVIERLAEQIEVRVDLQLATGQWPVYQTDDDRGLERDEYIQFARAVFCTHVAACPHADGWRPIETAPKDGTSVIVVTDAGAVGEAEHHGERHGWYWAGSDPSDAHDGSCRYPVMWQPLPAPPDRSNIKGEQP